MLRWKLGAALPLVAALAFFRIVVKDSFPNWAFLYYITPWPLLFATALGLACFWFWQKRRTLLSASLLLAVVLGSFWIRQWGFHTPARGEFRFVLWNVGHPSLRIAQVLKRLRQTGADIIAIVEMQPEGADHLARWATDGYRLAALPGNLLLMVRGEILSVASGDLDYSGVYSMVRVRVRGIEQNVLLVDLSSLPLAERKRPFGALLPLLAKRERLILAGDFNTPKDSVYLQPVRGLLTNSFEAAGCGPPETWPSPLPVLSLDQVWFGGGLRAAGCTLRRTLWSDHAMVIADYDLQ